MEQLLKKIKSHSLQEMIREYRWLSRYSALYKAEILWYIFIGILGTGTSLLASILSKHIIDAVTGFDNHGILVALLFFVIMEIFQILFRAISSRISTKINIRVNQQIAADVYDKLLQTDWESLSAYHSGDLLTRVVGDVSTVSSSVLGWVPDLITKTLQFAGTLGVILYYDYTLALLALISAPVTLLIGRYVVKMMRQHNQKMRKLSSEMTVFNSESFQNILLIKAFDRVSARSEKHRQIQRQYEEASLEYNRFSIRKSTLMSIVGTVVTLSCFCWSIYRLWSGHISYGTMTLFLQLAGTLSGTFSALAGMIPSAINAATAASRIMTITQLPAEDITNTEEADRFIQEHSNAPLSIHAKDLLYHYNDGIVVLQDTNFEIKNGQIVAFVGPSGEGKTTLLRLLLGIIPPKSGSLHVKAADGASIAISPTTRKLFAYVPQDNIFFTGTVADNLRLIKPDATDEQLYDVLAIACADEFIRQLPQGLYTSVKERGTGFSEGQLQRLCIARALLSDAPFLLMDEATSALDQETEQRLLQNIMQSQKNRTCIITTHRPSMLEISHQIYRIDQNIVRSVSKDDC